MMRRLPGHDLLLNRLAAGAAVLVGLVALAIVGFILISTWPLLAGGGLGRILIEPWRPFAASPTFGVGAMIAASAVLSALAVALAFPVAVGVVSFAHGIGPRRPPHLGGSRPVPEHIVRRAGQSRRGLLGDHETGDAVGEDEVRDTRQVGDDRGQSTGHRLHHHGSESLPARGKDEDIRCLQEPVNVFSHADPMHAFRGGPTHPGELV